MSTKEYTKEQYWQIFDKLPDELKTLMLAEETAKDIYDICRRNKVYAELVPEVARYTGRVLMGVILPKDFQTALEEDVGLESVIAKEVARAINRQIFFQVKGMLAELQQVEIKEAGRQAAAPPKEQPAEPEAAHEGVPSAEPEVSVKPARKPRAKRKSEKPDSYRESIE